MSNQKRRGISSWAISRPVGTLMLTSTLLVLGVVYIGRLPVDLLPRIIYPQVRVNVSNPGVEPVVLEETVAKPLETALATVEGLQRLQTNVNEGSVSVELNFAYGTNVDIALQNAATAVERVRSRLPIEASAPTVSKSDPSQMQIFQVAFSSSERDLVSLRQWIDQRLRPQLLAVEGVASVDLSGGLVREIQVEINPERLRGFGLSVSDVLGSLSGENQNIAGGRVIAPDREIVSRTTGRFTSTEEIKGVLLTGAGGTRVPLSEIATVRDTSADQRFWARLNGTPAVRIGIQKQPESNTVEVVDQVRAQIARLESSQFIPRDIRYQVTFDQSGFIRDALSSVRNSALIGAFLAAIVVLVFLRSIRKTFIIAVSIPLAIMATFVMMGAGGLTLNIMSLGGLAMGTGLLLDNAIVMLENIYRRRELEGLDPEEGAHVGSAEVTSAVVASTTTNLASVAPFLLIVGLAALIFRELILTISFAILASLPLALTLVPMLAAQLGKVKFKSGLENNRFLLAFDRWFSRMGGRYERAAEWTVRHKFIVLGTVVLVAGALFARARSIPSEFLPQVDDGSVGAFVRLAPGSTPQQTDRITREVEGIVAKMPHVEAVFATAGGFLFGGSSSANAGRGSLDILLVPVSQRNMSADQWVRALQDSVNARGFAGARVGVRPPRIRGLRTSSSGEAVSVAVLGDDILTLNEIALAVARRVQGIPGLENFQNPQDEGSPLLSIELDRERARARGLNVQQVGAAVRTALDGTVATRYAEGNFEYDVRVFFPRGRFQSTTDLLDIPLVATRGAPAIRLGDVADVKTVLGPNGITRVNQSRQVQINGDVITEIATVGAVSDSIRARLAELELPDGYGLIIGGEQEAIDESNRQLALVIALAIFLVFVVLAVQYESFINPFVILASVPLAMMGVFAILLITGTPFSAPVTLGMIMLAGIVVNNSILLVEFAENFVAEQHSRLEAIVKAGGARLRPIMMTTFTSLVGTLPLALGLGEGGELMRPLAIAVVGGLSVSTFLTLFVVPCTYLIAHAIGDRVKGLLYGGAAATPSGRVAEQRG
ncbi:MAG: efflux RND transporter permease subunit [Gemmatimonadaceae bacterium]|nr:efflux RND transporter permease subunit [Gemmatimonadaceae bacterium]MCW5825117.1 efflux RND transporter permease subunit [Gemmatimonadaceae bacterium]